MSPCDWSDSGQVLSWQEMSERRVSPEHASAFSGMPTPVWFSRRSSCRDGRWRRPCHSCMPARRRGCAAKTSARRKASVHSALTQRMVPDL